MRRIDEETCKVVFTLITLALCTLSLVLILFKACGVLALSWFWVLMPMWIPFVIMLAIILIVVIYHYISFVISKFKNRR